VYLTRSTIFAHELQGYGKSGFHWRALCRFIEGEKIKDLEIIEIEKRVYILFYVMGAVLKFEVPDTFERIVICPPILFIPALD
jgi:hypothetical protein